MRTHEYTERYIVSAGLLLLACVFALQFVSSTSLAQEENHSGGKDPFARFADANETSGSHSEIIKELCDHAQVDVIHSYSYYKEKGLVSGNAEPPEITKGKEVLKGLARIARSAMRDELDSQERFAVLRQLVRLETLVLTTEPLGSGNVEIGNSISQLISALVFQEVGDSDLDDLDRIAPLAQRDTFERYFTVPRLKDLFDREVAYRPSITFTSQHDLLASMLFHKYPEFADKLIDKDKMDVDSVVAYALFSHKAAPGKSRNPLIDVDPLMFASDFLAARELELCARYCVLYRKSRENLDNVDEIAAFYSQFKEHLVRGMTDFEKQILGSPETDEAMSRMTQRIVARIRDNLRSKGKTVLELLFRRFSQISTDNDLPMALEISRDRDKSLPEPLEISTDEGEKNSRGVITALIVAGTLAAAFAVVLLVIKRRRRASGVQQ